MDNKWNSENEKKHHEKMGTHKPGQSPQPKKETGKKPEHQKAEKEHEKKGGCCSCCGHCQ